MDPRPVLVAVMGPTASGKTAVAEAIARELDGQLINADAFQIYRGMDIGTAKPEDKPSYKLLDIREPDEDFGAGEWAHLAAAEIWDAFNLRRSSILVGGTGFYIRALTEAFSEMAPPASPELRQRLQERLKTEGLQSLVRELLQRNEQLAATIDCKNPVRVLRALEKCISNAAPLKIELPPLATHKFCLQLPKDDLEKRIGARVVQMVQNGWSEEVARLRHRGYGPSDPGFRAIGYRTLWRHLEGELGLEEAIATTIAETKAYAKRQRTWLRKEPRLISMSGEPGPTVEQVLKHLKSS